jgi:peptidoglycan/LPS O-acetylase OafA/YrhL
MSPFELVFTLFGLLLGLAVAEVLGGLSRAFKLRRSAKPVRIGWLTPLLGLFVVLDLTSFWGIAYDARDQLGANYPTLVAVLAIVGTYYLAATQIFPDDPEEWPDFDAYYDRHNRIVLAGMLAANIGSMIGQGVLESMSPSPAAGPTNEIAEMLYMTGALTFLAALIALMIVKSRRWNVGLLALLIVLLLVTSSIEPLV